MPPAAEVAATITARLDFGPAFDGKSLHRRALKRER